MKKVFRAQAASAMALIVLGTALLLVLRSSQKLGEPGVRVGEVQGEPQVLLPEHVSGYQRISGSMATNEVAMLPKDTTYGIVKFRPESIRESRTDVLFPGEVVLRVVLMGKDRSSIHRPEYCLTGQGWKLLTETEDQIHIGKRVLPVKRLVLEKEGWRGVYLYWFVEKDRITARHREWMLSMARGLLTSGTLQRWSYVSCFSICAPGHEPQLFERMEQFLGEAVPEFQVAGLEGEGKLSR